MYRSLPRLQMKNIYFVFVLGVVYTSTGVFFVLSCPIEARNAADGIGISPDGVSDIHEPEGASQSPNDGYGVNGIGVQDTPDIDALPDVTLMLEPATYTSQATIIAEAASGTQALETPVRSTSHPVPRPTSISEHTGAGSVLTFNAILNGPLNIHWNLISSNAQENLTNYRMFSKDCDIGRAHEHYVFASLCVLCVLCICAFINVLPVILAQLSRSRKAKQLKN
ncbi:hypothetical protein WG66_004652 [Moniliophthora roreri]|nr:hypothetical protein WG66_004652 [Moniliophthora roreri]